MSHKFKLGDIVRCTSDNLMYIGCKGKIGKIIYISNDSDRRYTVEFFEHVNGHDGLGHGVGKRGYCWAYFTEKDIELYQPILKTFLKEKENEL